MRLIIKHATQYAYGSPVTRLAQSIRMTPTANSAQQVLRWQVRGSDDRPLSATQDGFGNIVQLHHPRHPGQSVSVTVEGEVLTEDKNGLVVLPHECLPPVFFTAPTAYTQLDKALVALGHEAAQGEAHDLAVTDGPPTVVTTLHRLMALARQRIDYVVDVTSVENTASEALAQGSGVCQDHAHVMIAAAHSLGIPARYVSGYLWTNAQASEVASHAWMEAFVPDLGWVGFDAANQICPDDRYVRLAYGRDYTDAAPVRGVRVGGDVESLHVSVQVQAASRP